jgi:mRNA interferase RelE/StbE
MYLIRILDTAARDLAKLDKQVGRRVVNRVRWLAANVESVRPESLTGDLAGLCKLRVGDYRVLYEVLRDEQTIVIHIVGHRREVYKGR